MNGQQMKADALDFWEHLRTGDVKSLFGAGTDNSLVQLFRYALVGGSTFLVDYVLLLVLTRAGVATVPASGISFATGIVCNFLLTKFFAFKSIDPRAKGAGEVGLFAVISLVGLGLTMVFMYLFTDLVGIHVALAKPLSSALVFFWNFLGRKLILYPGKKKQ